MEEADYPALYRAANSASMEAQKRYLTFVRAYSALLILAAGLGVYGIQEKRAAIAAALLIIGSIFLSVVMLLRRDEDVWYRARAVAESIKTSCWRFMMKADPYLETEDVREVKSRFRARLKSILKEHKDLSHHLGGPISEEKQITERMCEIRGLQWGERAKFYRQHRIDEQRSWYAKKSAWNRRHGTIWLSVLIACQSLAVVFVIMRVAYPSWGYWPSEVFVVAAGSALTWIQAKRFRELAAAYALTAHEVGVVRGELEGVDSENQLAAFVSDSENVFSREHTQWLARKDAV